ncbi:MAG: DNA double-strand break repair protein Mre11, partial [Xenococcaceae cyanobacterium]
FCPLSVRPFCTIDLDVSATEDPQKAILKAIAKSEIDNAVVRLIYHIRSEQLESVNVSAIHEALKGAHNYTMRPELISQLARPRLPELGVGSSLDPLDALKAYLNNREDLQNLAPDMLEAACNLLDKEEVPF